MTTSWLACPFDRSVELARLGPLGESLSRPTGHSRRVCPFERDPGWLYKEYRAPLAPDDAARVSRLVALPGDMTDSDVAVVTTRTAWPSAQVLDGENRTVGVLVPRAPRTCDFRVRGLVLQERTLNVDLLALPDEEQHKRSLPRYSTRDRLEVCADITAVAALFERHGLVYLDWSYANVLWSVRERSAFVIDIDGSSFGPRTQVQSPMFEDPLVPMGRMAGTQVDCFRVALLTARCLTGRRSGPEDLVAGLTELGTREGGPVAEAGAVLAAALVARTVKERPTLAEIDLALACAREGRPLRRLSPAHARGNVKRWRPVSPPSVTTEPARPPFPNGQTSRSIDELADAVPWPIAVSLVLSVLVLAWSVAAALT